jgi:hypothetical protein
MVVSIEYHGHFRLKPFVRYIQEDMGPPPPNSITAQQTQLNTQNNESHLHTIVAQLLKKQSSESSKWSLFE